jgi:opacity protein-like surface antigen
MELVHMELKSPFKLSLIFLLVAAPTVTLSQPMSPCNFNGFTVGLGLGATTFMTQGKTNATLEAGHPNFFLPAPGLVAPPPPVLGTNINVSANNNIYRYGAMGAIYVGYGNVFDNNVYLGAELGLNIFGATNTSQKGASNSNIDVSGAADDDIGIDNQTIMQNALNAKTTVTRNSIEPFLDIKLGYLVTPTMLAYIKGGINYNDLEVKTSSSYQSSGLLIENGVPHSNFPLSASGSNGASGSNSKNGIGWRAGIGMEVMVTPQLGVGGDYVYTFYRQVSANASGVGTDAACDAVEGCVTTTSSMTQSGKATIDDQEVMAKLIYHFG